MSEQQVIELIRTGTYEAFLDCLDFAPVGVVDLIKQFAVSLPMEDYHKKEALKKKTGFDVDIAIRNQKSDKEEDSSAEVAENKSTSKRASASGRRTSANYKSNEND